MIGIHHSGDFTARWIAYCQSECIEYKLVNAYDSDIIQQLSDCDAFMWHFSHINYKDMLFARQLIFALEAKGLKVFPNSASAWHFDDKVGQKYLLESIAAPIINSYVFYTRNEAINWIKKSQFPKVFKLRGGSGSRNVILVKSEKQAVRLVNKSFSKGFKQYNPLSDLIERWRLFRLGKTTATDVIKGIVRFVYPSDFARFRTNEVGYAYFQDFIDGNSFDIRVVVVDNKAFALKRLTRKNDFRASGSGLIHYNKSDIDIRCVEIALDVARKLHTQSIAFDFVFDNNNHPLIVEISYGYATSAYDLCEGYWDETLNWHPGTHFNFCGWMVQTLIK